MGLVPLTLVSGSCAPHSCNLNKGPVCLHDELPLLAYGSCVRVASKAFPLWTVNGSESPAGRPVPHNCHLRLYAINGFFAARRYIL